MHTHSKTIVYYSLQECHFSWNKHPISEGTHSGLLLFTRWCRDMEVEYVFPSSGREHMSHFSAIPGWDSLDGNARDKNNSK